MPQQRSEQDRLGGPDPATARHRGSSRAIDAIVEDGNHAQGEPFPALFGIATLFAVVGLRGLAIGTLVRHSAAAVTVVVAYCVALLVVAVWRLRPRDV